MDWNLSSYFSAFDDPVYRAFKQDLEDAIAELAQRATQPLDSPESSLRVMESLLLDYESLLAKYSHLASYLGCLTAADSRNEAYLKEETALARLQAELSKLSDRVTRLLGGLDTELFEEILERDRLETGAFRLREMREEARLLLSDELEALAADLGVNGISAWSRMYFTFMGNLEFHYTDPEEGPLTVPMAQLNNLLSNPDRSRRIAASEGAADAFEEHRYLYASALNAISGTRHTLNNRRKLEHFLEPSLRQNRVSHGTLTALMSAVEDRLPFAREVFRFRSECLDIADPGYVDLRAPLPVSDAPGPDWEEGVELISGAFGTVYPALGNFFDELIDKQWVDHTPRPGKRPGGFCTGSLVTRESRIFMTYKGTLNDVLTLAHEAGHAWHSRILKDTRVLSSRYPMTLAETASTFAERIFTEGILSDDRIDASVKLIILDAEIEHMLSFLLDLPVRFRFEEAVYERRQSGTLSPGELCELMRETQRRVFGEVLAEGREDPWFWASKLHFYINEAQFYNYPYTFGYLLSTGFMEQFRKEGSSVLNAYERFLRRSGTATCEEAVRESLGEDIEDPNFWGRLIDQLSLPFERYQKLLAELYGG